MGFSPTSFNYQYSSDSYTCSVVASSASFAIRSQNLWSSVCVGGKGGSFPVDRSHDLDLVHLRNFFLMLKLVFPFYTQSGVQDLTSARALWNSSQSFLIYCGAAQSNTQIFLYIYHYFQNQPNKQW